ncbi:MAG TPA: hypothetical protein VN767_14225 [Streptosporangiaceae bacterium]|nr:hypothetical protein [Streptosporangiaceae bacterium]
MFDLNDEMRQLAAEASHNARPMAVTEVIRRGNRRRTRTIAQRSIGGLSAVGLGAAVLFTGGAHHLGGANPAAAGATSGGNTLSVSSTSALGNISMRVKYVDLPTGKVHVVSVTYSGDLKKAPKRGSVEIEFGPGLATGKPAKPTEVFFGIDAPLRPGQHHFSGSLSGKRLAGKGRLIVSGNSSAGISVEPPIPWTPAGKNSGDLKPAKRTLTAIGILTR